MEDTELVVALEIETLAGLTLVLTPQCEYVKRLKRDLIGSWSSLR